ncbi:CPBP family intramembrane glutamic endopeptidase [Virgibacillus siamensis]|uniref:CPBP family intramembrane glutamic endopeptidase n=1 Tax=Virgibacillus siamensis TaxID=480071 RepID=UPI0009869F96|nr:type II CAAX endopeptidase family protein [Virgibacillus siamensis]
MTKRYWYVILTYIVMQFSGILFIPLLYFITPFSKQESMVTWTIISFLVGLVIILFLMKPDMKTAYTRDASSAGMMAVWVITGVIMAYLAQGLAGVIESNVFGIRPGSQNTEAIMSIARAAPVFMIIPALIAPIMEEIIFRKIIFGVLYKRTNFFLAALLSSFIFGIIHGEPEHILIYASMGFVFAFLYVQTKRIIVPILVHMLLNSISVIVQFSLDPEQIERMIKQSEQMQMILIGG